MSQRDNEREHRPPERKSSVRRWNPSYADEAKKSRDGERSKSEVQAPSPLGEKRAKQDGEPPAKQRAGVVEVPSVVDAGKVVSPSQDDHLTEDQLDLAENLARPLTARFRLDTVLLVALALASAAFAAVVLWVW